MEISSKKRTLDPPTRNSPLVTRRRWPPLMPRSKALPTIVSLQTGQDTKAVAGGVQIGSDL